MLEKRIVICNQLGLHARAAAQLVRLAGTFQSEIKIRRTDTDAAADAKSILDVLTLAAAKGKEISIEADGADEKEAIAAVVEIFTNGFGEK